VPAPAADAPADAGSAAPAAAAGEPPTAEAPSATDPDPHGLGVAAERMSGGARRHGRTAISVAAGHLADGERVELVLVGRYLGFDAAMVLTPSRLLIVNDRPWDPEITVIDDVGALEVSGWADRRAATLELVGPAGRHVIDRIADAELAESMAVAIRSR
jgi:hypothetical protein